MNKTVAYVGNFGPSWSTENDYRLAFEAEGWNVILCQENAVSSAKLREAALSADLLCWTGTWDDAQPMDESLETFALCKDAGVVTATVHLDKFIGLERGGRQWQNHPMFFTSRVFTADGDPYSQAAFEKMGITHSWLPPAVRHTVGWGEPRHPFFCGVAFVGADGRNAKYHPEEWPYRRELVDQLEDICRRRGWVFRNPGGRDPKIPRMEMADFYASANVTVGDSLAPAREQSKYWSDRVFECTGRGGLVIMPRIDALQDLYGAETGALLPSYDWGDWECLEDQISLYLLDQKENREVREELFEITHSQHTYRNRVRQMLQELGL